MSSGMLGGPDATRDWVEAPPLQPPFGRVAQAAFAICILTIVALDVVGKIESGAGPGGPSSAQIVFNEVTSAIVSLPLMLLAWPMLREIHRRRLSIPVRLASLAAMGLGSGLLHVAGFKALRIVVSPALGLGSAGPFFEKFGFELGKDAAFYSLMVGGLFAAPLSLRRAVFEAPVAPPPSTLPPPPPPISRDLIDLPSGRHRLRLRTSDIVAVVSAGNYAEFRLLDGRRPLLRATLAVLETQLADRGLLRVHRSWIVNPDRVHSIRSLPSGDARLTLATGDVAPASRRYADGISRLLGAGQALGGKAS